MNNTNTATATDRAAIVRTAQRNAAREWLGAYGAVLIDPEAEQPSPDSLRGLCRMAGLPVPSVRITYRGRDMGENVAATDRRIRRALVALVPAVFD